MAPPRPDYESGAEPHDPAAVLADATLTDAEKKAILSGWEADLLERLKAAEENMPSTGLTPGQVAETLSEVKKALARVAP